MFHLKTPSTFMNTKILIADDEPRIRKVLTLLLEEEGYQVRAVNDGKELYKPYPNIIRI